MGSTPTDTALDDGGLKVGRTALAGGAILSLGAALVGPVGPADAATFDVTNTDDAGAGSLRQAILDANAAGTDDEIDFAPGLTGTITLTGGEIPITDGLVINGPGAASLTVDAGGSSRIFYISTTDSVTVSGLTLTGGQVTGDGGAILAFDADLTIEGSVLSGNTADEGDGGAINLYGGDLTVTGSTFTGNAALEGGGIYSYYGGIGGAFEVSGDDVVITDSTFSDNDADDDGGAIEVDASGDITIERSTFSDNVSGDIGGAAELDGDGNLVITDSSFTGNAAEDDGGGTDADVDGDITITGTTITGNYSGDIGGGAELTAGGYYGGLVGNVTITGSTISGNESDDDGGGLEVYATGDILITDTTITGNTSGDLGGGAELDSDDRGRGSDGGGEITIVTSTISGNSAEDDGGGLDLFAPGGITLDRSTISGNATNYNGGGLDVTGPLTITSSTISGNAAGYDGGGISVYSPGRVDSADVSISHSTIADNTAAYGGGLSVSEYDGYYAGPAVSVTVGLDHTILSGNGPNAIESSNVDLTVEAVNSLIEGDVVNATFDDQGGNVLGESADLLPLADNGGPTQTHALAATSPALDGGDPGFTPPPATDQRGLARVQGEAIDIGAYETQPTEEPVDPTDPVGPTPPGALPVVANPTFTG